MATVARGYLLNPSKIRSVGLLCFRCFATTPAVRSGHNKWSKIKHDKAKVDAGKSKHRATIAQDLASISKLYGPNPDANPRLATLVATAKRQGVPKSTIENAIARGQGISPKGAALETLTVEAIIPPSIATIIECQTDSKARTLADMRLAIKDFGGTVTPASHFFERRGKLVFENANGLSESEIFDKAIEAAATDVQVEEDGTVFVYTKPNQTKATAQTLSDVLGLKVQSSDLVWDPKEDTRVEVDSMDELEAFLDRIQKDPSVQGVYMNTAQSG